MSKKIFIQDHSKNFLLCSIELNRTYYMGYFRWKKLLGKINDPYNINEIKAIKFISWKTLTAGNLSTYTSVWKINK